MIRKGVAPVLAGLLGLVGLLFAEQDTPISVTKVEDSAIFVQEAELIVPESSADIIVDINLREAGEAIKKTKSLAKWMIIKNPKLLAATKARISALVDQDVERWERLAEMATSPTLSTRAARFLGAVAAVVASAAAGVTGFLWGQHEDHQALLQISKEQGHVIHVLAEDEEHVSALERHSRLQDSLLQAEAERAHVTEQELQAVAWIMGALAAQDRHLAHLERTLGSVLTHHRLGSGLWTGQSFARLLRRIKNEAQPRGLTLALEREADILRTEVSFGTFTSLLVRIVVHVPLHKPDETFRVMRWVQQPLAITGWHGHGAPKLEDESARLAISRRGRQFVARSTERATWWRPRTSLYISASVPVTEDSNLQARSCLGSLWRSQPEEIIRNCEIRTAPQESLEHLTAREWLACGNGTARLEIRCQDKLQYAGTPLGCLRLALNRDCQVTFGSLEVRTKHMLGPVTVVLEVPRITLARSLLVNLANATEEEAGLRHLRAWHPGTRLHSAQELHPVKVSEEWGWLDYLPFVTCAVCAVALVVAGAKIGQRWGLWCGTQGSQSQTGRHTTASSAEGPGDEPARRDGSWSPSPSTRRTRTGLERSGETRKGRPGIQSRPRQEETALQVYREELVPPEWRERSLHQGPLSSSSKELRKSSSGCGGEGNTWRGNRAPPASSSTEWGAVDVHIG